MEIQLEVLKTGSFTDSSGNDVTITEDTLQHIADSYDPCMHEAPLVIGHPDTLPKSGEPAYGWIDNLYRKGDRLFAKAKQIIPELLDMITAGHYKKVSVGLTPDNTLHHVGLLGAQPPAVKGLAPITFSEAEGNVAILTTATTDDTPTGNHAVTTDSTPTPVEDPTSEGRGVNESVAASAEFERLQSQIKSLQEKIDVLTTTPQVHKTSPLSAEADAFLAFIDEAVNNGKITPAQAKLYKELTAPLKPENLTTFSENPGSFFSVARALVTSNQNKLRHPVNYNHNAMQTATTHGAARNAIAKQMNI